MKILIASGGTKIQIDDVRHIDNISSGRRGAKLAEEFAKNNHNVIFFHRKGSVKPFEMKIDVNNIDDGIKHIEHIKTLNIDVKYETFNTYDEYRTNLKQTIAYFKPDAVLLPAAVSDFGVDKIDGKIHDLECIKMTPLPKIIGEIRSYYNGFICGFKLLSNVSNDELLKAAHKTLNSLGEGDNSMIAANDLSKIRNNDKKMLLVFKNNHVISSDEPEKDIVRYIENNI